MAAAGILLGPSETSVLSTADTGFVARLDHEVRTLSRPCQRPAGFLQEGSQSGQELFRKSAVPRPLLGVTRLATPSGS